MRWFYLKWMAVGMVLILSQNLLAQGTWDTLNHFTPGAIRQPVILLDNGKVLIGSHYYYAYLYDPVMDTLMEYKSHGGMESVMVKLNNGFVLGSGGWSAGGAHFNLRVPFTLFNPQSNSLSRGISSHTVKAGHTGTLLNDGKVLLVGGVRNTQMVSIIDDPYISDTTWHDAQQPEFFSVYDSCYLFNPVDSSLTATSLMNEARVNHKALKLPNGEVLVVGGRDKDSRTLKSCEIFDPVQQSWTFTDSLPFGLSRFKLAILPSGDFLLTGGFGKDGASNICLKYQAQTHKWQKLTNMNIRRFNHTMTILTSGKVLVTGGSNVEVLSSTELYDPQTDTWSLAANLKLAREEHAAVLLNSGKVIVIGGINDDVEVRQMEAYQE